ncbi:MAG TPA: VOC family protein [bacterium]|nr:VOC family protein [bacterium]
MEIRGMDLVAFHVGDLNAGTRYYEDLGLTVQFRSNELGVTVFLVGGEFPKLLVTTEPPPAPPGTSRMWVEVADVQAILPELKAKTAAIVREPLLIATGWLVETADPWGNVLGFRDYTAQPDYGRPKK